MKRSDDEGAAMVEFIVLAVTLAVPLCYLVLAVFDIQRAAFGASAATREAARVFVRAPSTVVGEQRAQAAAVHHLGRPRGRAAARGPVDLLLGEPLLDAGSHRSVHLPDDGGASLPAGDRLERAGQHPDHGHTHPGRRRVHRGARRDGSARQRSGSGGTTATREPSSCSSSGSSRSRPCSWRWSPMSVPCTSNDASSSPRWTAPLSPVRRQWMRNRSTAMASLPSVLSRSTRMRPSRPLVTTWRTPACWVRRPK